jgi:hypothetical protein
VVVVSRWEKKKAMNLKEDAEEEDNLFDPAITVSLAVGMSFQRSTTSAPSLGK